MFLWSSRINSSEAAIVVCLCHAKCAEVKGMVEFSLHACFEKSDVGLWVCPYV